MFKISFIALIFLLSMLTNTHVSFAANESGADERLKMAFIAAHQKLPKEIEKFMLSPLEIYNGGKAGVQTVCFWTDSKSQIEKFDQTRAELDRAAAGQLQMHYEVQWGLAYTLLVDSGDFFLAGKIKAEEKQIQLNRACISMVPDSINGLAQIQKEMVTSFQEMEKIQSYIFLLGVLEQNPTRYKDDIQRVNKTISEMLESLKNKDQISSQQRDEFLKIFNSSEQGSPELRSLKMLDLVRSARIENEYFVPEHRFADFLSKIYELHKGVVESPSTSSVVWARQQGFSNAGKRWISLDFKITDSEELCNNYFSYALPQFVSAMNSKSINFKTTQNTSQILQSIDAFSSQLIPRLLNKCAIAAPIEFLNENLKVLRQKIKDKGAQQITAVDALKLDWDLLAPQQNYNLPENGRITDVFLNVESRGEWGLNIKKYSPMRPGDFFFRAFPNNYQAAEFVGKFGILFYRGNSVCPVFVHQFLPVDTNPLFEVTQGCLEQKESIESVLFMALLKFEPQLLTTQALRQGVKTDWVSVEFADYSKKFISPGMRDNYVNLLPSSVKVFVSNDTGSGGVPSPGDGPLRTCQLVNNPAADYSYCQFSRANFMNKNFGQANFTGANLEGADLRGTNLSNANLIDAKLRGAVYNVDNPVTQMGGTRWPRTLRQAQGVNQLIPYEACTYGYDDSCKNSPSNPYDCLRGLFERNGRVPLACAAAVGVDIRQFMRGL